MSEYMMATEEEALRNGWTKIDTIEEVFGDDSCVIGWIYEDDDGREYYVPRDPNEALRASTRLIFRMTSGRGFL